MDGSYANEASTERPLWPFLVVGSDAQQPLWFRRCDTALLFLLLIARAVAVTCFVLVFAVVVAGVLYRYGLNDPLTWSETIALWALIWMVFVGAPVPLASSSHYAVEALVRKLPDVAQIWLALVLAILALGFCLVVARQGLWLAVQNMHQIAPAPQVPYAISYAAIPVGFSLMSLVLVRHIVAIALRLMRGKNNL